jgi:phospholipid/cholesterol/gamma-HCH transport system substrate-binding protein
MRQNVVETILGAVVLIVALAFFAWAYARSDVGDAGGYTLVARFDSAAGLDQGSDVRISGIKVGQVVSMALDPKSFRAEVRFTVRRDVELPTDSSAAISSASLLGGKYLSLEPGADDQMLAEGDTISFTQSSINIEDLVGRYIFGTGAGGSGGGAGGGGESPGTAPAGGGAGAAPQ